MDLSAIVPGLTHQMTIDVTPRMTVPELFEADSVFDSFPAVYATGMMVATMELACVQLLHPLLPEGAGSLGTHIDVSHEAATTPGGPVTLSVKLTGVDRRRVRFDVEGHDGVDRIGGGTHERAIIDLGGFSTRLTEKASQLARIRERSEA